MAGDARLGSLECAAVTRPGCFSTELPAYSLKVERVAWEV